MKKILCFLIGLFIIFSINCYAGETLTTQQKKAEKWFKKAKDADAIILKIEYYTKAIEIDPKFASAYNNRGLAYSIHLGEHQKAIDDYSKAIEIDPKNTVAYNNRGLDYVRQGFSKAACDDFYQAGILYLKQNNRTQALKYVDRIKKTDPLSSLINKLLDQIYAEPKEK